MTRPGLLPAILLSLYVLSSAFWARPVTEALRQANLLRLTLTVVTGLLLLVAGRAYRWRLIPTALVLSAYAALVYSGRLQAIEEWIHILHVTVLAFMFQRALKRPWLAAAMGGSIGVVEEFLQIWAPRRIFDWQDVGLIALSGILAGFLLRFGVKR